MVNIMVHHDALALPNLFVLKDLDLAPAITSKSHGKQIAPTCEHAKGEGTIYLLKRWENERMPPRSDDI